MNDLFKIEFIDCWEKDKRLPPEVRWLAIVPQLKIVVTAPTHEDAFEEIMTSIRVMAMYQNGLNFEPKEVGDKLELWESFYKIISDGLMSQFSPISEYERKHYIIGNLIKNFEIRKKPTYKIE